MFHMQFVSEAECLGEAVRYYLLEDKTEQGTLYGIRVEYHGEEVSIPHIDRSSARVHTLLDAMVRACVTPVTALDVTQDWMCQ